MFVQELTVFLNRMRLSRRLMTCLTLIGQFVHGHVIPRKKYIRPMCVEFVIRQRIQLGQLSHSVPGGVEIM